MKSRFCLSLLFFLFPLLAHAYTFIPGLSGNDCGNNIIGSATNLSWGITADSTLIIYGEGPMKDYFPDPAAPWRKHSARIKHVHIGDSVSSLGNYAMYQLAYIDTVILPVSVKSIGTYCFNGCARLKYFEAQNGLKTIGSYAFNGLSQMTTHLMGDSLQTIGGYAFGSCSSLKHIDFGKSLQTVGYECFYRCTALDSIHLPGTVTSISTFGFWYCTNIKRIVFDDDPTGTRSLSLGSYSFANSSKATEVVFPNSLASIADKAFQSCSSLQKINLEHTKCTSIGPEAFAYAPLVAVVCPSTMRTISGYAFSGCNKMKRLSLNEGLTTIGDNAFKSCSLLTSIVLPSTLSSITSSAFNYCSAIDTIIVAGGGANYDSRNDCNAIVRKSDNCLISGCATTTIPASIRSINAYAFRGHRRLLSIIMEEGVTTILDRAFDDCSGLQTVQLPNSVYTIGEQVFNNCSSLVQPVMNSHLIAFVPRNTQGTFTLPATINRVCADAFRGCTSITNVVFSSILDSIGKNAFNGCTALRRIILPSTLTFLGEGAFRQCAAADTLSLPLSPTFTTIQPYTFEHCSQLKELVIPDNVSAIGNYSFDYCSAIRTAALSRSLTRIPTRAFGNCSSLRSVSIPDAVSSVDEQAFQNCSTLTSITIPAAIASFGRQAFAGCTSLDSINWNARQCANFDPSISSRQTPFQNIASQITFMEFGDSVRSIPNYLCYQMSNLRTLSFGENVTTISSTAFSGCTSIDSVFWNARACDAPSMYIYSPFYNMRSQIRHFVFGDSVCVIPSYLCYEMDSLRMLSIPQSVSAIGDYAFRLVCNLDSIAVSPLNTYFDSRGGCNAIIDKQASNLVLGCWKTRIPSDISYIGDYAFQHVPRISTLVLPDSIESIGLGAFYDCQDLATVMLSDNTTEIGAYAFEGCTKLLSVYLGSSLNLIGLRSFARCSRLNTIQIPASVNIIDQYAFSETDAFQSIYCNPLTPPQICLNSFDGIKCPFYVPCSAVNAYRTAENWASLRKRIYGQFFYQLNVHPNDPSFGSANILQNADCENDAMIEAVPVDGFRFVQWQDLAGRFVARDNPYTFTLTENTNLTAYFEEIQTSLEDLELGEWLSVKGLQVSITPTFSTEIWIYDTLGRSVAHIASSQANAQYTIYLPAAGVYIISTGTASTKILVK